MEQTLGMYTNYRQNGVTGLSIHVRFINWFSMCFALETNTVIKQILGLNVYGITIHY